MLTIMIAAAIDTLQTFITINFDLQPNYIAVHRKHVQPKWNYMTGRTSHKWQAIQSKKFQDSWQHAAEKVGDRKTGKVEIWQENA